MDRAGAGRAPPERVHHVDRSLRLLPRPARRTPARGGRGALAGLGGRPPPARMVRAPARRRPGARLVARQCGEHRRAPRRPRGPRPPRARGARLRLPRLRAEPGRAERAGRVPRRGRRVRRPGDARNRSRDHRVLRRIARGGGLHRGRDPAPLRGGRRGLDVHAPGRRGAAALRPPGGARGRPVRLAGAPVARVGPGLHRPRRPGRDRPVRAGRASVRGGLRAQAVPPHRGRWPQRRARAARAKPWAVSTGLQ